MADIALAAQIIASHYAEPVQRVIGTTTPLHVGSSESSKTIRELTPGEPFAFLDDSLGWAWGYAGSERRVGYVRADALAPQ